MGKLVLLLLVAFTSAPAVSQEILYLASSDGRFLQMQKDAAIMSDKDGARLASFSGYGAIRSAGKCLTSSGVGDPLRWSKCAQADSNQTWRWQSARLQSLTGVCAEYLPGTGSDRSVLIGSACSNSANQRWMRYVGASLINALREVEDQNIRQAIESFIKTSKAGQALRLSDEKASRLPPGLILWEQSLISAGNGKVVRARP